MSNTAQTSAMERISGLLDENSFVEIGAKVTRRSTDFNMQEKSVPADGVITGYGIIDGSLVYVYSQDASMLGGSMGEMHAKKICNLYDLALKVGAPIIGLIDCAGLRLQEATDALAGFGELYHKQTMASGVIPQIAAIFGTCGGGSAISATLSDFTFMAEKNAKLFVNSPNALDGNYIGKCDTSSAKYQAEAGVIDFLGEQESDVLEQIRQLVSIIPTNNEDDASFDECEDDLNRTCDVFSSVVDDPAKALADISDDYFFLEVKKDFAKEMVTGFIRFNGMTIGAVANRKAVLDDNGKAVESFDETLTTNGCYKAEKFIEICDAYNIPILSLTNVTGYKATTNEEKSIAQAAAKLTYAFSNATVAKVNLITKKAFGSAYITMNSKHIGADLVFALPSSKIGMMDAKSAVQIMYAEDIKNAKSAVDMIEEKVSMYESMQSSADVAASRGYVDSIIEPESVRKQMIFAFEMLFTKRENRPSKKHGTV